MLNWGLRPATVADVETIADLRAVVMRPDLERLGRFDENRVRQWFRDAFDPAHTRVITVDGAFAGCLTMRPDKDDRWLEHFLLTPRVQGNGVGTAVLRTVLKQCDGDRNRVRLRVLQGSPARRLYERHGFVFDSEDSLDMFLVREPVRRGSGGDNAELLRRLEAAGGGHSGSDGETAAEIAELRRQRDERFSQPS